jgi:hypothetical protein
MGFAGMIALVFLNRSELLEVREEVIPLTPGD